MECYAEYKDSGVEWVGDIPSHWKLKKLGYCGLLYGGLTGKSGEDFKTEDDKRNRNYVPYTNILRNTYISSTHFDSVIIEEGEKQNRVHQFDLFFLMSSEDYDDLGKSCVLLDPVDELYLNSFCKGFRVLLDSVSPVFLNYQLHGDVHRKLVSTEGKGFTRINLRQERLKDTPMFLPPVEEQERIVAFLDERTGWIDEAVKKTEKKIALLKEQRASLINEVVTKGLDPNVEMQDSGVEWIGHIPNHWSVVKLQYLCNCSTGGRDTQDRIDNGEYPFFVRSPKIERIDTYSFDGEAVLTAGDGVGAGKVFHHFNGKFDFHQRVYKFSGFKNVIGRFFFLYMSTLFINVSENQNAKSTVDSLRKPMLDSFPFALPPVEEQERIVAFLDERTGWVDEVIAKEEERMVLLKEYRQSLISEVVTGKRKVFDEPLPLTCNAGTY